MLLRPRQTEFVDRALAALRFNSRLIERALKGTAEEVAA